MPQDEKFARAYQYAKAIAFAKEALDQIGAGASAAGAASDAHEELPEFTKTGVPTYAEAEKLGVILDGLAAAAAQFAHEGKGPTPDEAANALMAVATLQRMVPVRAVIADADYLRDYLEVKDDPQFRDGYLKEQFAPEVGNALDAMKMFKINTGELKVSEKRLRQKGGREYDVISVDIPEPAGVKSDAGRDWLKFQRMATVAGLLMEALEGEKDAKVSERWSGSKNDYELFVTGVSLDTVRDKLGEMTADLPQAVKRKEGPSITLDKLKLPVRFIDEPIKGQHYQGTLVSVTHLDQSEQRKVLITLRGVTRQENLQIRGDEKQSAIFVAILKPEDIQNRLPGAGRGLAAGG